MFVRDFIHVPVGFGRVRSRLESPDAGWLSDAAGRAYRDGETLMLRVGPASGGSASKRVEVTLGHPYGRGEAVVVPVFWIATGASAFFPSLEGDIEFAPLDEGTQITLEASYEPPLGVLGRGADRVLLHRVAESTVRGFLGALAATLSGRTLPGPAVEPGQVSA